MLSYIPLNERIIGMLMSWMLKKQVSSLSPLTCSESTVSIFHQWLMMLQYTLDSQSRLDMVKAGKSISLQSWKKYIAHRIGIERPESSLHLSMRDGGHSLKYYCPVKSKHNGAKYRHASSYCVLYDSLQHLPHAALHLCITPLPLPFHAVSHT